MIFSEKTYVPGSKVAILGMVIPPLIGNPYNGYISPYYWVDDHPLLFGKNGSLDPGSYDSTSKDSECLDNSGYVTRTVHR